MSKLGKTGALLLGMFLAVVSIAGFLVLKNGWAHPVVGVLLLVGGFGLAMAGTLIEIRLRNQK